MTNLDSKHLYLNNARGSELRNAARQRISMTLGMIASNLENTEFTRLGNETITTVSNDVADWHIQLAYRTVPARDGGTFLAKCLDELEFWLEFNGADVKVFTMHRRSKGMEIVLNFPNLGCEPRMLESLIRTTDNALPALLQYMVERNPKLDAAIMLNLDAVEAAEYKQTTA